MKFSKGFTLIELLIVIGVLGILASGLMAAVDPFEQLKKARDANNRNAVIELHNATTRYYATHASLPWDDTGSGSTTCVTTGIFGAARDQSVALDDTDLGDCVGLLEDDGELKANFLAALGSGQTAKMFISSPSTTQVVVCFSPEGKGLFNDAQTKYNSGGTDCSVAGTCSGGIDCSQATKKTLTPGASCFWCAR